MDSTNSGSMQSSSAGDEEYNSNSTPPPFSPFPNFPPTPTSLFDNLHSYLDPTFLRSPPQPPTIPPPIQRPSPPSDPPRPSKKRPRASRRAPTTVLTTDTSNFRQMVQEFTGIPPPPFGPSPFQRSRFDQLFNSPGARAPPAAGEIDRQFLLRPFANKIPTVAPPFNPFASSSSPSTSTTSGATPGVTPNSSSNFQMPSELANLTNQQQSSIFSFPSQPYNLPGLGPKQPVLSGGLSSLFGSEGGGEVLRWGEGPGVDPTSGCNNSNMNQTAASTSGLDRTEKAPESSGTRGEGMLESWICSSD